MAEVSVGTGSATAGGFWTGVGNFFSGIGQAIGGTLEFGGQVIGGVGQTVGTGLTWIAENPDKAMELGGAAWGIYSGIQQYEAQKDAARDARRLAALQASMPAAQPAVVTTGRPQGAAYVVAGGGGEQGQMLTYVALAAVAILLLRK